MIIIWKAENVSNEPVELEEESLWQNTESMSWLLLATFVEVLTRER